MPYCIVCVFSIDQMSEIVRYAIETGIKLKEELVLEQEDFIVSPVRIVVCYICCLHYQSSTYCCVLHLVPSLSVQYVLLCVTSGDFIVSPVRIVVCYIW